MGTCVSRPSACVGKPNTPRSGDAGRAGGARRRRRRGKGRRKAPSRAASMETIQEAEGPASPSAPGAASASVSGDCRAYSNPAFQVTGSMEEAWYDSYAISESDGEDDFHSVHDDAFSLNGLENEAGLSMRDPNGGSFNGAVHPSELHHRKPRSSELPKGNLENRSFVSHDDSGDDSPNGGGRILDDCGLLPNNCLPCMASAVGVNEKKRALSTSPTHSMKMPSLKLSFKKKSGEANPSSTLLSTKDFLERPLAGSQVQLCLLEKKVLNSWSHIEPGTFRVRGSNYLRDKKKELAQNCAAYYPFGVDVFLSPQKLNHISRFVKLPDVQISSKLPPLLVVNVQVPLYPASLFQSETDGEGMSFVLYFRLSEAYSKELPPLFIENIRRLVDDDVEKIKGFPMETTIPFRERLKILGRVANLEDLPLSAAERKLMHAYNEKPVLSRPQHQFFLGDNYFEVDIDMHRFGYISRKGFETFLDRLKICMLDVGLTIQGNKPEELPEQVLCCVRLNGIDYAKYQPLMTNVA